MRYWARLFDLLLGWLIVATAAKAVGLSLDREFKRWLVTIFGALVCVPLEAICIAAWATTPGKWLLSVFVTHENGGRLDFAQALRRSIYAWFFGLAAGFQPLSTGAIWHQYEVLQETKRTTYDRTCQVEVHHGPIRTARAILMMFLIPWLFWLVLILTIPV